MTKAFRNAGRNRGMMITVGGFFISSQIDRSTR
jgi:hypothetical protein